MTDYTYPSVYLAYLFFVIVSSGSVYFFIRSYKDGYWDENGEDVKYQMLKDENMEATDGRETRK